MHWRRVAARLALAGSCILPHFTPAAARPQTPAAHCEAARRTLAAMPGLTVAAIDTVVRDDRLEYAARGCRVAAVGVRRDFGVHQSPDEELRAQLVTLGWVEDHRYGADGPDGTAFAFRHEDVICLARGRWDGGDDANPAYVPSDRYELTVACLRAPSHDGSDGGTVERS